VDNPDDDLDLFNKIDIASEIVMHHLNLGTAFPDDWIVDAEASPPKYQVPMRIQGYAFLVLSELWHNRESSTANVLSDQLVNLMRGARKPTLA
jgi:hypothetical protein